MLNIEDFFLKVKTNKMRILSQAKLVDINIKKFEANQNGLKFGTKSITDVVKSEQELEESIKKLSLAQYEFLQSYIVLLKHSGILRNQESLKIIKELFKK